MEQVGCGVTLREAMPLGKETPLEVIHKIGVDGLSGGISDVCFYPTFKCNLNCYMCLVQHMRDRDVPFMSIDQIKAAFDKEHITTLFHLGGEPFVKADMIELLEYFDGKGKNQIISTNGTHITESFVERLAALKHLVCVQVSLNGSGENDNNIRGSSKAFNKTVESIKILKKAGLPVWIHCVILNENIDDLANIVKLGAELGASSVNFIFAHVISEEEIRETKEIIKKWLGEDVEIGGYVGEISYTEEQLVNSVNAAKEEGQKHGTQVLFFSKTFGEHPELYWRGTTLEQKQPICQLTLMPPLTPAIGPDGSVYQCPYIAKSFGNINETPLEEIWDSEPLRALRKGMISGKLVPICRRCPCSDIMDTSLPKKSELADKDEWQAYLKRLTKAFNEMPELSPILEKIADIIFQYHISDQPELNYWHMFEKTGVRLGFGETPEENCPILIHQTDFETLKKVNAGEENPIQATMAGKYAVDGDMKKLMDCAPLLPLAVKAHLQAIEK